MAIYHFSVKVVSRGRGQSAVAKAAYNSRERLEDERTGDTHDYRRKGGILFSAIFAPKDAPEWTHDRSSLYNAVEQHEKRKDAQLLREVEIGLPHELTSEQRERLVKDFVREQFVRKGMVADVALHAPDRESDERNHHAHILLTMRELTPDGFGAKVRDWNSKEQLEQWRTSWENIANRYLEKHGHEAHIDRRTLEEQGIDREPTVHRGPHVDAMEREGILTEHGQRSLEVQDRNATREELIAELAAIQNEIRTAELEAYLDTVDRDRARWDDALHEAAVAKEGADPGFAGSPLRETEPSYGAAFSAPHAEINLSAAAHTAERVVGKVLDFAADGVEIALEAGATSFESLFEVAPKQGSKPLQRSAQKPKQSEPKPDLRRYLADDEYRRDIARREIRERERREREYQDRETERYR